MGNIALNELKKLPHLDVAHLDNRNIPFHALRDGDKWRLWFPGPTGLIEARGVPVEACYYAKAPVGHGDYHFVFLEFFQQHAYWKELTNAIDGVGNDLLNASACLAKLDLIFKHGDHSQCHRMVATEIEYIFLTCRSMFDLLQSIILALWRKVTLVDPSAKKNNLPDSYRAMVLFEEKPMSAEQISERRSIPIEMARVYADSAQFFCWLRDYRDLIAHKGKSFEHVYRLDGGFAVSRDDRPFSDMHIWCDANSRPNSLGSLRSVVAHLLQVTLATCDRFAMVLREIIQFPPPIAPEYHIFMCGPSLSHLTNLARMIDTNAWYPVNAELQDRSSETLG